MRTHLIRAGAAIGAAALSISTLFMTAGPAHATAGGNLLVTIVDQYGQPVAGVVQVINSTGFSATEDGSGGGGGLLGGGVFSSTHTFTLIPADGYEVEAITPWSGVDCFGISPCSPSGGPLVYVPVVTVTDGGNSSYVAHVTMPTVTGSTTVPGSLAVTTSPGYQTLAAYYGFYGGGVNIGYQWTRSGADIPGASTYSYSTVPADGSRQIAARLLPSPGMAVLFGTYVAPYTTQPVTMAPFTPAKTKTKIALPSSLKFGSRVTMKIKVKSKSKIGGAPVGQVTVKIGQLKIQKPVKNGKALVNLPNLRPGSYTISVSYSGSDYFAKSKAKTSLTVHK